MIKINKIILSLILHQTICFAQKNIIVNYTMNHVSEQKNGDIEEFQPIDYLLKVKNEEASFEEVEKLNNSQTSENRISGEGLIYKNLTDLISLQELDLFGKRFILRDTLQRKDWKISKTDESILNFKVNKATFKEGSVTFNLWYAKSINSRQGPSIFFGLPGLILKAEIIVKTNDYVETTSYVATKIKFKKNDIKINNPTKGEIISKEELQEKFSSWQKQMQNSESIDIEN